MGYGIFVSRFFRFCAKGQIMKFIVAAAGFFSLPVIALAHHAMTGYVDERQELRGELVDVIWRNPHIGFVLGVVNEDGERELWKIEGDFIYS